MTIKEYTATDENKIIAEKWFSHLRDSICKEFEQIENSNSNKNSFKINKWNRDGGGGGKMSIMKGDVFEKVGVNISTVHGKFTESFRSKIPGAEEDGNFWASGISVVSHPKNPFVPAAHMNTRLIVTSKTWFGGGGDITPMKPSPKMSNLFHENLKKTCNRHDEKYYDKFKAWADEYFFIKHRNETRGDGGIFFDYINTGSWDKDFNFVKDIGHNFLTSYSKIIKKTQNLPWNSKDREDQLVKRGRYAEFNLLYDRGTLFGLKTGGNTDAILMSLPPEVKWS
ncbi:MAG: oxygen-dependent coproporphyrinogen oxidase [SAR116 cluster bacterium]|nr:oxygen-dependent coproporphyrinogen oxidase [SAR116 cluster bacterium]